MAIQAESKDSMVQIQRVGQKLPTPSLESLGKGYVLTVIQVVLSIPGEHYSQCETDYASPLRSLEEALKPQCLVQCNGRRSVPCCCAAPVVESKTS